MRPSLPFTPPHERLALIAVDVSPRWLYQHTCLVSRPDAEQIAAAYRGAPFKIGVEGVIDSAYIRVARYFVLNADLNFRNLKPKHVPIGFGCFD